MHRVVTRIMTIPQYVALHLLLIPAFGSISTASAGTREYLFSGPSVTGRFIVEEFAVPTEPDVWSTTFTGAPYLFTATAGTLTYTFETFGLELWNEFPAFGLSDRYVLSDGADKLTLGLLGPSQGGHSSTLPHELSSYSGVAVVLMWDPVLGSFAEFRIDTLTSLPQAQLSIARAGANSIKIMWSTQFADHSLEYAMELPATGWSTVNETVSTEGDRLSVVLDATGPQRFYRLRKP